jgi:glycosyltransferase involved in cell wall biosynthesis
MNILYVASGIPVPGSVGGSTHVIEVTRGLADLGHKLLVIAGPANGDESSVVSRQSSVVNFSRRPELALTTLPAIWRWADEFRPDVVMERYYNFAGAGLLYARRHRLPSLLEVNAPLYDPPGSRKDRLDRRFGRPLRRWARWQARAADRIVTPLATTAGKLARPGAIVELPWGANTDLFDPARRDQGEIAATRASLGLPPAGEAEVVAFSGSFRPWHGVETLLAAARQLLPQRPGLHLLLIGDGPERPGLTEQVRGWGDLGRRVVFTGRLPYDAVPRHLAVADIGVAPFEPVRHEALRHFGFYWSPLKIFEYGAMALPTVCPAIPPLDTIVRDGREGRLYAVGDPAALAASLAALLDAPPARRAMGASARQRVVRDYSWAAHCRSLDAVLREITGLDSSIVNTRSGGYPHSSIRCRDA